MSAIINIATKAAYLASKALQQASRNLENLKEDKRTNPQFIREIQELVYQIIYDYIHDAYPSHTILSSLDAKSQLKDNEPTWLIEPIDGINNFINNNPNYAITIAFCDRGKISEAIILDPNRNDIYKASLRSGAMLNDKRLRLDPNRHSLNSSIIASPFVNDLQYIELLKELQPKVAGYANSGSLALDLGFIASGAFNAYIGFNHNPYVFAAAYLILTEARAVITDFYNQPVKIDTKQIIIANQNISSQLNTITKTIYS